jgi:cytochrome c553
MNTRNKFAVSVIGGAIALLRDFSASFRAKRPGHPPRIVTWNCSGCHGVHGNAQLPEFPRLAGLDASYIEQRIAAFRAAPAPPSDELLYRLFNPAAAKKVAASSSPEALANMVGIAHAATPQEIKAAAAWYSAQKPKPAPGTPPIPRLRVRDETSNQTTPGKTDGRDCTHGSRWGSSITAALSVQDPQSGRI